MSKVKMETKLPVRAEELWKTIGNFGSLADWNPTFTKSEATGETKGSTRTLTLAGGGQIEERLEQKSDSEKLCRYSILSGPLPLADYVSELRVRDNGDGTSTVEWSSEFQPKGAPESDVVKSVRDAYQAGFDNLQKMFGR
jgi:Polyketide cyclase / dehydrase and lipid transport